jgi:hypothetical protein
MISPGISQYFDYCGNDGWLVDMDTDVLDEISQNRLMGESLSDTIIRGARTHLGLKPH